MPAGALGERGDAGPRPAVPGVPGNVGGFSLPGVTEPCSIVYRLRRFPAMTCAFRSARRRRRNHRPPASNAAAKRHPTTAPATAPPLIVPTVDGGLGTQVTISHSSHVLLASTHDSFEAQAHSGFGHWIHTARCKNGLCTGEDIASEGKRMTTTTSDGRQGCGGG